MAGDVGGPWQVVVGPALPACSPRATANPTMPMRGGAMGLLGRFGGRSRWMMLIVTVASTFVMLGSAQTAALPLAIASAALTMLPQILAAASALVVVARTALRR